MTGRVLRRDDAAVCTLLLNRPDKLNALDTAVFEELDAHLATVEAQGDSVGCVVLRGAGRGFCARADLTAMPQPGTLSPLFKPRIVERLGLLPQPVVAAVHGVCLTGGLELALACDFIVADGAAQFADTHGRWGLVGAWGLSRRLPRRIGGPAAKRMMMTARSVGAAEALAMGLVDLLAGEGGLDDTLGVFVAEVLANSRFTNSATKRLMNETDGMSLADGLAHAHRHHPGTAPDHGDRLARFGRARRAP